MAKPWKLSNHWPGWRGSGSGRIEARIPVRLPSTLKKCWRVEVGEGHSSPITSGNDVYVFSRENDREILRRLQLNTGREIWRASDAQAYEMHPAAQGHGKGPRATPALSGNFVVTLGVAGALTCRDARTGKSLWRKEATTPPDFGAAASPLLRGNRVFAQRGGRGDGVFGAYDLATGKPVWEWKGDDPAYAAPVLVSFSKTPQLVSFTRKRVVSRDPATGKLLWELPFVTQYDQNCVTPVEISGRILLAGMRQPTALYRAVDGKPVKVWETTDVTLYMSTGVYDRERFWGFSEKRSGQLFCLDVASGKTLWKGSERQGENATILSDGRNLFCLTTDGVLRAFRVEADSLTELVRWKVADTPVWASPVFVNGGVLVKDLTSLTLWSWE